MGATLHQLNAIRHRRSFHIAFPMRLTVWIALPHMPTPQMTSAFTFVDRATILVAVHDVRAMRLIPNLDHGSYPPACARQAAPVGRCWRTHQCQAHPAAPSCCGTRHDVPWPQSRPCPPRATVHRFPEPNTCLSRQTVRSDLSEISQAPVVLPVPWRPPGTHHCRGGFHAVVVPCDVPLPSKPVTAFPCLTHARYPRFELRTAGSEPAMLPITPVAIGFGETGASTLLPPLATSSAPNAPKPKPYPPAEAKVIGLLSRLMAKLPHLGSNQGPAH